MFANKKNLLIAALVLLFAVVIAGIFKFMHRPSVVPTTGNWGTPTDPSVSEDLAEDLARAAQLQYPELAIEPLKVLETQVVGGMKYRILCNVTEKDQTIEKVVTLYVNPELEPDIMGID